MGSCLTKKQIRIIFLASEGLKDSEICEELSISENTLKDHWRRIKDRLEARTRAQVIAKASKLGVL